MLYHWYEMSHAAMGPARALADSFQFALKSPLNPIANTAMGRNASAALEMFERTTRRYSRPRFGIEKIDSHGVTVPVHEEVVWEKPFCRLLHFRKETPENKQRDRSRILIVAPMSGHYSTLLRGTVRGFLPRHDVYITDWRDARNVPLMAGNFDLDDYIDYLIEMYELFEGNVHVIAVCQPSVPVLSSIAVMEAQGHPHVPHTMTLMGGPVDTRRNPTAVNKLAEKKSLRWFERNVIMQVPFPNPGFGRKVYPGFIQLSGFMTMNLDKHVTAHKDHFKHLIDGDGDSAAKHTEFYDEYLAVMDLTAEFYLQTIESIFMRHALANGTMTHRDQPVDPSKIKRVSMLTVEGENDDITGKGQCAAAHDLCSGLDASRKTHYEQPGVGHYGVFNGSRFLSEISPRISDFIDSNQPKKRASDQILRPIKRTEPTGNINPFGQSWFPEFANGRASN